MSWEGFYYLTGAIRYYFRQHFKFLLSQLRAHVPDRNQAWDIATFDLEIKKITTSFSLKYLQDSNLENLQRANGFAASSS